MPKIRYYGVIEQGEGEKPVVWDTLYLTPESALEAVLEWIRDWNKDMVEADPGMAFLKPIPTCWGFYENDAALKTWEEEVNSCYHGHIIAFIDYSFRLIELITER